MGAGFENWMLAARPWAQVPLGWWLKWAATASCHVLRARALSKHYGDVIALSDVDLHIPAGFILGLVGNNGAGKTTAIKACAGLLEPTSGSVRVGGEDPTHAPVRQKIGFLPEDSPVYDDLSPRAYLRYFGRLYGVKSDTEALLDRLRLDEPFRDRPLGQLSKGSRRKTSLARCLLHDPDLIILDEPASGLDPATRRAVDDLLLELRAEGKAILLSAHDLDEVERLSDHIVVLHEGRIATEGDTATLRAKAGPTTYIVRAEGPFAGSHPDGTDHVAEVSDWPSVEALLSTLEVQVLDVTARPPRLADVLAA